MGGGLTDISNLNLVDYVHHITHIVDSWPEEVKEQILSVRIDAFPHDSTNDLLANRNTLRFGLFILFNSDSPPKEATDLLHALSKDIVDSYYRLGTERDNPFGSVFNLLDKIHDKVQAETELESLKEFFAFSDRATNTLNKYKHAQNAISNPNTRKVLISELEKVHHTEFKHSDRMDRTSDSCNGIYINIHSEIHRYRPLEFALLRYVKENMPEGGSILSKAFSSWPPDKGTPLENCNFTDTLTKKGTEVPLEVRQIQMKNLRITENEKGI